MGPKRKSVQDGPNNVNVGEQATAKRRKQSTSRTTPSIDYDMLAEAILRKQSPPVPVLANSASVPYHMDVPNNNNQCTMQPSCFCTNMYWHWPNQYQSNRKYHFIFCKLWDNWFFLSITAINFSRCIMMLTTFITGIIEDSGTHFSFLAADGVHLQHPSLDARPMMKYLQILKSAILHFSRWSDKYIFLVFNFYWDVSCFLSGQFTWDYIGFIF